MGFLKKYSAKLFLKQWNIGLTTGDIGEIIRQKDGELAFRWITLQDKNRSYADPFIFKDSEGSINILFEDFTTDKQDGKIALLICDKSLNAVSHKIVLETGDHLSYPFIFEEFNKLFIFPENADSGAVYCYEFDPVEKTFINRKKIINSPLIDPTIIKYEGRYWLFGTKLGTAREQDRQLFLYYSDSLFGPYKEHSRNPVKDNLNGSRPAGNFIKVDGNIYRPVQNCKNYYGECISINKINVLNEREFSEEEYMKLYPDKHSGYNKGLHTINVAGDIIIADGLKFYFQPMKRFMKWVRKG